MEECSVWKRCSYRRRCCETAAKKHGDPQNVPKEETEGLSPFMNYLDHCGCVLEQLKLGSLTHCRCISTNFHAGLVKITVASDEKHILLICYLVPADPATRFGPNLGPESVSEALVRWFRIVSTSRMRWR